MSRENYSDVHDAWRRDPEAFWMQAAQAIDWDAAPSKALFDADAPLYDWFSDGLVNGCWNAVDRHVAAGHGDRLAIIHDSPVTDSQTKITFAELQDRVARLAGALAAKGVAKGDRVVIYMAMVPEALVAMLACARIGAIHSVVFGGFASSELAKRIDDAAPKCVIATSCGIEPARVVEYGPLLDGALDMARHAPEFCVILQRDAAPAKLTQGRDIDWHDFQAGAALAECVPVAGDHPAYLLYTSGTTGQPKGVVRPTAGHLVALDWTMTNIYGLQPGEVFWTASDVGWVVGHSYIVYAPLIHGCTTLVFEGKPVGTPDAGAFWRVIAEHDVKVFFTAPTAFRAIKREDPQADHLARHDTSGLRALFLAGERADPDTVAWAEAKLGVPVVDHWWQTETGYAITATPLGLEAPAPRSGSSGLPMPGYDVVILDEAGAPVAPGTLGNVAIRLPLPPGCLPTLWNATDRYRESYLETYPGHYRTGDSGMIDDDGFVYVMTRSGDVINVAGHRLSTGGMEEVLSAHPDVAECAVVGVADEVKGQVPLGLICLTKGVGRGHAEIAQECVAMVRDRIGPVAAFRTCVVVDRLPKTRSGKILRSTMAKIAEGEDVATPPTIDDPAILDEIAAALRGA